jgi:imidazolonepropionase-like amidohydrolase
LLLSVAIVSTPVLAQRVPDRVRRTRSNERVDSGRIAISLLGREVGGEAYRWRRGANGSTLDAVMDFTDRGTHIQLTSQLTTNKRGRPERFEAKGRSYRFVNVDIAISRNGDGAQLANLGTAAPMPLTEPYWFARGYPPLSARAALIEYWERCGRPPRIRAYPDSSPHGIRIRFRGTDTVGDGVRAALLRRYTVDGVIWGAETVWLDSRGLIAAVLSRVHLLPLEAVRPEWRASFGQLWRRGVDDAIADQAQWRRTTKRLASRSFALVGARVIDGTGSDPIDDATVVVRDGRIAAVGTSASTPVPNGVRTLDAHGTTVLPGLWDMHAHASQIEWGPAYLAAGVTSVRDMGGDTLLVTRLRDAQSAGRTLSPRLVLAGLVDGDTTDGFGNVVAGTVAQGRAVVEQYAHRGYRQIKLYSVLRPDVVAAITRSAHEHQMTVTGHVPRGMTVEQASDSGMDQIAHLPFRGNSSDTAELRVMQRLGARATVIDPTLSWSELLGRADTTDIASFEPMIKRAPPPLAANYRSVRNASGGAAALTAQLVSVRAMHDAGIRVVAGTDGGIPGASLLRELELFVRAGLTPHAALIAATADAARAAGMEGEVGTIQTGRRADLLVLDADPLANISNVRRSRWVITNGDVYRTGDLWPLAGFTR